MAEVIIFAIAVAIAGPVTVATWRYARRQTQRADALMREGWMLVGWNFITGPVLIPPPFASGSSPTPPAPGHEQEGGNG